MLCAARALLSGAEVTSAAALPICSADGIPAQAVARGGLHGFARVGSVSMWGMESTHCVGPIPPAHGGVRNGPGRPPCFAQAATLHKYGIAMWLATFAVGSVACAVCAVPLRAGPHREERRPSRTTPSRPPMPQARRICCRPAGLPCGCPSMCACLVFAPDVMWPCRSLAVLRGRSLGIYALGPRGVGGEACGGRRASHTPAYVVSGRLLLAMTVSATC